MNEMCQKQPKDTHIHTFTNTHTHVLTNLHCTPELNKYTTNGMTNEEVGSVFHTETVTNENIEWIVRISHRTKNQRVLNEEIVVQSEKEV